MEYGGEVARQICTLFAIGATGEMSDGELLQRFATGRGDAAELAFSALVERHGPMVLQVCQATLDGSQDAHDAFQATFLVLVRKAHSLWVRDSLGPWLHQVAYRTASCLRASTARQQRLERCAVAQSAREVRTEVSDELIRVLHEELGQLPERYRAPVVLCDLEASTHEQASRHLGWPIGTVKSRLTRARLILGDRLRRRGYDANLGLIVLRPGFRGFETVLPPALVNSTTRAVIPFITARTILAGSAAALAREVLAIMSLHLWCKITLLVALVVATATGVVSLAQKEGPNRGSQLENEPQAVRVDSLPASVIKPAKFRVTVIERGRVEASRFADVMSEVEGVTILKSILPEGSKVKKGDQVGTLDSSWLKDQLQNQQNTMRQAEASYENAKLTREVAELALVESIKQEQETLQATIAGAKSAIQMASTRLERILLGRKRMDQAIADRKGAVTPSDIVADLDLDDRLELAGLSLKRENQTLEQAENRLRVRQKPTWNREMRELAKDIEKSKADELTRKATLTLEKAKFDKLEKQIKSCVLIAPGNGVINYVKIADQRGMLPEIEEGAAVRERQRILSIVDLDGPMRVFAKIRESKVDRVARGVHARIRVDAFPGKTLNGVIDSVAPRPDQQTFLETKQKVYLARVLIEDPLPGLQPGLTADVEIPIFEPDNVLSVPRSAVLHFDGKPHVAVRQLCGGFEWRDVTMGEVNDTAFEIKQGLRSGDSVILNPLALMSEDERRAKKLTVPNTTRPPEQ